jgi:hypothetical protein
MVSSVTPIQTGLGAKTHRNCAQIVISAQIAISPQLPFSLVGRLVGRENRLTSTTGRTSYVFSGQSRRNTAMAAAHTCV